MYCTPELGFLVRVEAIWPSWRISTNNCLALDASSNRKALHWGHSDRPPKIPAVGCGAVRLTPRDDRIASGNDDARCPRTFTFHQFEESCRPDAHVFVPTEKQTNGTLLAGAVLFGKGVVPPM